MKKMRVFRGVFRGVFRAAVLTLSAAVLAGCGQRAPPEPPAAGGAGFAIEGEVRNAKTGEPVSRETIYLHFFCDDRDFKRSLSPEASTTFEVEVPGPDVRVRAFDQTRRHELFERTIRLDAPRTRFDVALVPVDSVLLRGRVIDKATGEPMKWFSGGTPGDNGPLFYVDASGVSIASLLHADAEGAYSLWVPRSVVSFRVVDTPKKLATDRVDLTRIEGGEHVFDLVLE